MTTWAQFETEAPELAAVAARLWAGIVALQRHHIAAEGQPCFAIDTSQPCDATVVPGCTRSASAEKPEEPLRQ